jgi:hypothetical protein
MDLIGDIKYLANRLGGRKPNHGKRHSVQKTTHNHAVDEKNDPTVASHSSPEFDTQLGRKVDITA